MIFETAGVHESPSAVGTREGFLSGVDPHMNLQLFRIYELLSTLVTRVRSQAAVDSQMSLQVLGMYESFSTLGACLCLHFIVRFLLGVEQ